MHHLLQATEEDGFPRRSFPTTVRITFSRSQYPPNTPFRLVDPDGQEAPVQIDPVTVWDNGSMRTVDITFAPFLNRGQTKIYTLDDAPGEARVRNPVTVHEEADLAEVRQGVIAYTIPKQDFNLVDTVVSKDHPFLQTGACGPVLVLNDNRELMPEGPVTLKTETRGPWAGRLHVEGTYPEGYAFLTDLTFVSSKTWFLARHQIVSGNTSQIKAIHIESHFNLPDGPLTSAFGARTRADGVGTGWAVVTDGVHTVDIATPHAWFAARSVRYECEPNGLFRAMYPFENRACQIYYHYLSGPPDDIKNTPAAAMVAGLRVRQISPGG